jgi:sugar phosphate isomerase/epimerase
MTIKLGVDSICYQHTIARGELDLEGFLDKVVAYGGQSVQIDPIFPAFGLDLRPANVDRLRVLLAERGLEIVVKGNSGGTGFLAVEGPDIERIVEAMREKFAAATVLGARVVRLVSRAYPFPAGEWIPPSIPRQAVLERVVKTLHRLLPEAEEWGLVLALENHGDLRIAEMEWILAEVDSPTLRVQLDVAEQTALFEDALEAVRRLIPHAVTVHWTNFVPRLTDEGHLKTSCRPCEGLLPLDEMVAVLRTVSQDLLVFVAGQTQRRADEDAIVKEHMAFLSQELLGETSAVASQS